MTDIQKPKSIDSDKKVQEIMDFVPNFYGQGVMKCPTSNDVYQGQFMNGKLQGHGKIIRPDGTLEEGDFSNNVFHGQGQVVYTEKDEKQEFKTLKGTWKLGNPVRVYGWIKLSQVTPELKGWYHGPLENGWKRSGIGSCFYDPGTNCSVDGKDRIAVRGLFVNDAIVFQETTSDGSKCIRAHLGNHVISDKKVIEELYRDFFGQELILPNKYIDSDIITTSSADVVSKAYALELIECVYLKRMFTTSDV